MTAGVAVRGKRAVAIELAACVLCIYQCVGKILAAQPPRIGAIDQQAIAAYQTQSVQCYAMVLPVVEKAVALCPAGAIPGDDFDLTEEYTSNLCEHVALEAAKGLAEAMDVQCAKGRHPDVAWQYAVAGYGLDSTAMRGYIAAASSTSKDGATTPLLAASRAAAQKMLVAQADKIGEREVTAWSTLPVSTVSKADDAPIAAGLAVRALDTGRILMLQRALDGKDPAGGCWEMPGGKIDEGEMPLDAAVREWREEVGRRTPNGVLSGSWRHGVYQGYVLDIPAEADLPIHRGRGSITNPDDPDGDAVEQFAWWDPDQLPRNPAVRSELRESLPKLRVALSTTVSKAGFEEDQRRGEGGRWARTGGPEPQRERAGASKPKRKLKLMERDAAAEVVEQLLADATPTEDASPFEEVNPFASANPFAQINPFTQVNPFEQANPFEQTNPFDQVNPFAAKPRRGTQQIFLFGGAAPNEKPVPVTKTDANGYSFYLPYEKVAPYFLDENRQLSVIPSGRRTGITVDFSVVGEHIQNLHDDPEPIELIAESSPWNVDSYTAVLADADDWSRAIAKGKTLWDIVDADPITTANKLGNDIYTVAEWAGYPTSMRKTDILEEIRINYEMREHDIQTRMDGTKLLWYRSDLLDALADFAVWRSPRQFGSEGVEFANILEHDLDGNMDDAEPRQVLSFSTGLTTDENAARVHGQYHVSQTHYQSALSTLKNGAPAVGKIGLLEIHMGPDD